MNAVGFVGGNTRLIYDVLVIISITKKKKRANLLDIYHSFMLKRLRRHESGIVLAVIASFSLSLSPSPLFLVLLFWNGMLLL